MSIPQILKVIHSVKGWKDFTLSKVLEHQAQVYVVRDEVETLRCQGQVQYALSLYVDQGKGRVGQSTLRFGPDMDHLKKQIERTLSFARMVNNPGFELPAEQDDSLSKEPVLKAPEPQGVLAQFERIKKAAQKEKGVWLAQTEVWEKQSVVSVCNSRGLNLHEARSEWLVDFTLLAGSAKNPKEQVEQWFYTHRQNVAALEMEAWVKEAAANARNAQRAELPPTGKRPVILTGEALDSLFEFFLGQGSAQAKFEGWSSFVEGKPVLKGLKGDPLTLRIDPTLPGLMGTGKFDIMGCVLRPFTLVAENKFCQWLAPKPYSDYAGLPATGAFSNLAVAPGPHDAKKWVKEEGALVLANFSTFHPNEVTGAFSAEVRMGYLIRDGKKVPIKGGSISGMVNQCFKELALSKQITQRERYLGPEFVRLPGVTVAGS